MEEKISGEIVFESRKEKGWTVWALSGSMNVNTSTKTEEAGKKILASTEKLAIDLAGLKYLSSAGLRVFMRFGKQAKKEGKNCVLVSAKGIVADVLKESKIDMVIPVKKSMEELD